MNFFSEIRQWFIWATQVLVDLAMDCYDWPIVGDWLGNHFRDLSDFTAEVAGFFWDASHWWEWVEDNLQDILSWSKIKSLLSDWLDMAENAWYWVRDAKYHVRYIIEEWWATVDLNIPEIISDLESWVTSQLNTFEDTVLSLINDVKDWTLTQIDNTTDTLLTLINNLKAWTTTQINNTTNTLLDLISNVKAWTTTQINNVRDAILLSVSDVRAWTLTEVNNIKAIISVFLPWGEILANIVSWGALTGLQIGALVASWFKEYEQFWAGWQDIRDTVYTFFNDPVDWLWVRFTDWFLGPEE